MCLGLLCVSCLLLIFQVYLSDEVYNKNISTAGLFDTIYSKDSKKVDTKGKTTVALNSEFIADGKSLFIEDKEIQEKYRDLYLSNNDLYGWITIDDIGLNTAIMYSKVKDYYLYRDFKKLQSDEGIPYIDNKCFNDCGNYIVYGHNLANSFSGLFNYKDKSYWEGHKTFQFNSLYEDSEYEIISVFDLLDSDNRINYASIDYTDLTDKEVYDEYVMYVKSHSLYEIEIEAEHGEDLLTLVSCACHTKNGRIVVVAKKIAKEVGLGEDD